MQGEHLFYAYACESREDEDIEPPFAVVGSNVSISKEDGKVVRGREYPWGVVDIENKVRALNFHLVLHFQDHCDFTTVQNLLWGQNTQDLLESTDQVNYFHH